MNRIYACIDLKSFYASVECRDRNLEPITTNLVVADKSRTEKTICLAVTPALKKYGLSGRSRLYEVVQKVKSINYERKSKLKHRRFLGKSFDEIELDTHPEYELDYIVAPPRMSLYIKYSTKIYSIYLKYISSDDIFVYSIDEVFCDITDYVKIYNLSPRQLITKILCDVYKETGITATAGIGTNMYLAKVAMDIVAKHMDPDINGTRIACIDEVKYRKLLWNHKPITDFWRVGRGYSSKLEKYNIHTMGDIARCSMEREELLYKLFGINAEILIDHSWGYEPCTIKDVKEYKPSSNSLSVGQVLHEPYEFSKTKIIIEEMAEDLSLQLVSRNLLTKKIVLTIGYDIENITNSSINYTGEIVKDMYGRDIPKHAHGTITLNHNTSSTKLIVEKTLELFYKIMDKNLLTRRINISANVKAEDKILDKNIYHQFDIFSCSDDTDNKNKIEIEKEKDELKLQKTMLNLKYKYGKNSIVKALDLSEGATTMSRNRQIGGHSE